MGLNIYVYTSENKSFLNIETFIIDDFIALKWIRSVLHLAYAILLSNMPASLGSLKIELQIRRNSFLHHLE